MFLWGPHRRLQGIILLESAVNAAPALHLLASALLRGVSASASSSRGPDSQLLTVSAKVLRPSVTVWPTEAATSRHSLKGSSPLCTGQHLGQYTLQHSGLGSPSTCCSRRQSHHSKKAAAAKSPIADTVKHPTLSVTAPTPSSVAFEHESWQALRIQKGQQTYAQHQAWWSTNWAYCHKTQTKPGLCIMGAMGTCLSP